MMRGAADVLQDAAMRGILLLDRSARQADDEVLLPGAVMPYLCIHSKWRRMVRSQSAL